MSEQCWQVYYQAGMSGGSFTCNAEAEALALAEALTKARHFRGSAVVFHAEGCTNPYDAVIVWEAGDRNVIPCRPHGITFDDTSSADGVWAWRDGKIVASISGDEVGAFGALACNSWCDHTSDEAPHEFWDDAPITLTEARRRVLRALHFDR